MAATSGRRLSVPVPLFTLVRTYGEIPPCFDQRMKTALKFHKSLKDEVLVPDVFHTKTASKSPLWEKFVSALPPSISFYGAFAFGGSDDCKISKQN